MNNLTVVNIHRDALFGFQSTFQRTSFCASNVGNLTADLLGTELSKPVADLVAKGFYHHFALMVGVWTALKQEIQAPLPQEVSEYYHVKWPAIFRQFLKPLRNAVHQQIHNNGYPCVTCLPQEANVHEHQLIVVNRFSSQTTRENWDSMLSAFMDTYPACVMFSDNRQPSNIKAFFQEMKRCIQQFIDNVNINRVGIANDALNNHDLLLGYMATQLMWSAKQYQIALYGQHRDDDALNVLYYNTECTFARYVEAVIGHIYPGNHSSKIINNHVVIVCNLQ